MKKVFIIILQWNGWHLTEDCLKSLWDIEYDNYQIVLVDNGSKPEEKALMSSFVKATEDKFILIESETNLGFSGGNNIGMEYALEHDADYILLLNNDTVASDKQFLNKLVARAESDKKIGIVGPKIYYFDNKLDPRLRGDRVWFGGGKLNWLKTEGRHLFLDKMARVDFITGCCLLIRKEVIDKIGLMPEEFFLYFEDADWCLMAQEAGYLCVYEPSAILEHKVAQTTGEYSYNYIYYNTRNGLLLASRHSGFLKKTLIYLLACWIIIKQKAKLMVGYKKEWSSAMLRGAEDFLRKKFGKLN